MRLRRTLFLITALLLSFACRAVEAPLSGAPAPDAGNAPGNMEANYELSDESPAPEAFTVVRVGRGDAALPDILRSEAQKAAALGRDPYVEFYADWCPPCTALRESLSDARMVDAFTGTYIIKLDLDQWERDLPGAGFYVVGIPAFYELDQDGGPTGRMITGGAWGEDVPENIAPPMKDFFHGGASNED